MTDKVSNALNDLFLVNIMKLPREEVLQFARDLGLNIEAPAAIFYDLLEILRITWLNSKERIDSRNHMQVIIDFLEKFPNYYSKLSKTELQNLAGLPADKYYPYPSIIEQLLAGQEESISIALYPGITEELYHNIIKYNPLALPKSNTYSAAYLAAAADRSTETKLLRDLRQLLTEALDLEKAIPGRGTEFLRSYGLYYTPGKHRTIDNEYENFLNIYLPIFQRPPGLRPLERVPLHLLHAIELKNYSDQEIINFLTDNRPELWKSDWLDDIDNRYRLWDALDSVEIVHSHYNTSVPGSYLFSRINRYYRKLPPREVPLNDLILLNAMINALSPEDLAKIPPAKLKPVRKLIAQHRSEIEHALYEEARYEKNISHMIGDYVLGGSYSTG